MAMCRNIKTLHNFAPPATDQEIRASALQFVRKLSGCTRPSKVNQLAFNHAVDQVAQAAHELLDALVTTAPPRDRALEAARARVRAAERFHAAAAAAPREDVAALPARGGSAQGRYLRKLPTEGKRHGRDN
jgi:hypothetical protein